MFEGRKRAVCGKPARFQPDMDERLALRAIV
jgi:hypothetical protein